ncbi:MAG TPA: SAM-dependent chlorinase/fluorinase [Pirellulaceae bacterium]|nr:SAM-dependent chlorinase/fluorinase [Pirellulaceae bacterium]
MPRPIITLTTDFGTRSSYVAQMKGVILALAPETTLVDLTHEIAPQNIRQAALFLRDATPHFSPGTVHVAVIDPGVGTARQIICAELAGQCYLAPDNGVLSLLARESPPSRLIAVTNPRYWRATVSNTFHGRDIFAPVAAQLSLGLPPTALGETINSLETLAWPEPLCAATQIAGEIIDIDSFGNLISNIHHDQIAQHLRLTAGDACEVLLGGSVIGGLSRTYGERRAGSLVAICGSGGYLEVAIVGGSAASILGVTVGAPIRITRSKTG